MRRPRRVTAAQVKELRRELQQGASLRKAAMKTDMDRKSARKYRDLGQLPEEARKPHTWRTRPDPLVEVWPAVAEQLQQEPRLQAKTLWEWLQRTQPGKLPDSVRRTETEQKNRASFEQEGGATWANGHALERVARTVVQLVTRVRARSMVGRE